MSLYPNSALRKQLQEAEDNLNGTKKTCRVKITERAGPTIGALLYNKIPWQKEHCGRPNCAPCGTKTGKCKTPSITYRTTCETCKANGTKATYIGESSRTWYDRAKDHVLALKNKNGSYGIVKHWMEIHPEMEEHPKFSFNQIGRHKSTLERQIWEAIYIERENHHE